MRRVEGKVAIVTGGAQGLGEAAVRRLTDEGARVVVADKNITKGRATANKYHASFLAHDACKEDQWEALIEFTLAKHRKIDILVNNAGIFSRCPVDETSLKDFRQVIDINLVSCFLGCKHGVRAMKHNPHGIGGSIINLSSVAGLRGQIGGAAYASSKGGVTLLTKAVAMENAAQQIRCNSIHPGTMDTPMLKALIDAAGNEGAALESQIESQMPMGHIGTADNVGDMVLFLASDESKYITGAEMVVDGGLTVGLPM